MTKAVVTALALGMMSYGANAQTDLEAPSTEEATQSPDRAADPNQTIEETDLPDMDMKGMDEVEDATIEDETAPLEEGFSVEEETDNSDAILEEANDVKDETDELIEEVESTTPDAATTPEGGDLSAPEESDMTTPGQPSMSAPDGLDATAPGESDVIEGDAIETPDMTGDEDFDQDEDLFGDGEIEDAATEFGNETEDVATDVVEGAESAGEEVYEESTDVIDEAGDEFEEVEEEVTTPDNR